MNLLKTIQLRLTLAAIRLSVQDRLQEVLPEFFEALAFYVARWLGEPHRETSALLPEQRLGEVLSGGQRRSL